MKYIFLNTLLIMIISGCNQADEKTTKIIDQPKQDRTNSLHALEPGCFRMIIGKDTADLNLIIRDSIVTGSLTYNRFEKDDSRGELQGVIREKPLANMAEQSKSLILIGPEGDFSNPEIELATTHGFIPVSLGETRLRTETAGMVAAVLLNR